jgi:uncharacterized membrane protein
MNNIMSSSSRRIARCFLTGLLAILPLLITVGVVIWVASFVEGFLGPKTLVGGALQSLGLNFGSNRATAYVFGWVFVLAAIFALGLVVEMGAKRVLQPLIDSVVSRIPIIGNVYGTSKQLVEMFDRKSSKSDLQAMSVVFCSFSSDGGPSVLALMPSPEKFKINDREYHVVIIPTAPVPFGGGLLFMPIELVEPSDMSVDGLMSIYVSMGVTTPQFIKDA